MPRFSLPVALQRDTQTQRNLFALVAQLTDAFGPAHGHALPQVDSLPDAGQTYRGTLYLRRGDPDRVYVCCKQADGSYDWTQLG